MPCNLSSREQLARAIMELEIEDLMELESDSDREEDILLLHDLYTKHYLFSQLSINLSKIYSPEDLMQLSPSNFKQLNRTTHIAFGKLGDLLGGNSIFYNNSRHKQLALEIKVAVKGLARDWILEKFSEKVDDMKLFKPHPSDTDRDPFLYNFFIQSQASYSCLSRYIVLKDETNHTVDDLQNIANLASSGFQRATKTVEIATPTYYANLVATRAKKWDMSDDNGSTVFTTNS
ncbi:hypothetical protein BY996DRAFT_8422721 [Phakopsora pachyrhizi]|nr:hypothetical protein BY996DRAFT_8422721 [Phakopsora pachyrhizi]